MHKPSAEIAIECLDIPDYKTETTKRSYDKFGEYAYDHPELDDPDAVTLPPHKLTNHSIYIGTWKNGGRHGRGK